MLSRPTLVSIPISRNGGGHDSRFAGTDQGKASDRKVGDDRNIGDSGSFELIIGVRSSSPEVFVFIAVLQISSKSALLAIEERTKVPSSILHDIRSRALATRLRVSGRFGRFPSLLLALRPLLTLFLRATCLMMRKPTRSPRTMAMIMNMLLTAEALAEVL